MNSDEPRRDFSFHSSLVTCHCSRFFEADERADAGFVSHHASDVARLAHVENDDRQMLSRHMEIAEASITFKCFPALPESDAVKTGGAGIFHWIGRIDAVDFVPFRIASALISSARRAAADRSRRKDCRCRRRE